MSDSYFLICMALIILPFQMCLMHSLFNKDEAIQIYSKLYFMYMMYSMIPMMGLFIWMLGESDYSYRKSMR